MATAEQTQPLGSSLPQDHFCPWRDEAQRLSAKLSAVEGQRDALQRQVFGQKSEKMPTIDEELRRHGLRSTDPQLCRQKRTRNATLMSKLLTCVIGHFVPKELSRCPHCGSTDFKPLGQGKKTVIYELIPAQLQRQVHLLQTLICPCGKTILTAPGPVRIFPKARYGPRFIVHLVVTKCLDTLALNRLAERFRRQGVPLSRNTLVDLFQRAGRIIRPLADLLLKEIAESDLVQSDATTQRVQAKGKTQRAYLWAFLAPLKKLIGYRFSLQRNGRVVCDILGHSQGVLVADADKAFNEVCEPGHRRRAGCMSHARRKFFDALSVASQATQALDFVLELYRVERQAKDLGIEGTPEHLQMRQSQSRPVMERFHAWLQAQQPSHAPKSLLGKAIGYALNNWQALCLFLTDARIPLDNNASEQVLRIAAKGRQNFLFVGNEEAGHNLAALYSLVMTAVAQGLNPEEYLADVLIRIQHTPAHRLGELLPRNWKPSGTHDTS